MEYSSIRVRVCCGGVFTEILARYIDLGTPSVRMPQNATVPGSRVSDRAYHQVTVSTETVRGIRSKF